jgi:hypothetical protein
MNRLSILFVLVLIVSAINAAAKLPPLRLDLGTGLSQPIFAYSSPSLGKGCFTKTGLSLSGTASVNGFKQWWWDVRFEAQLHPVDVARLGYERVISDPFLTNTYIRSEPYRHLGLLTGPSYLLDHGKMWFAQASVLVGLMQSKTPHQLHKPTYFMTGPEYFEISSAIDYSVVYGAEIAAGWKVTPCYYLKLASSYFHTDMDFRFRTASGIRIDSRTISTINLRAGLVFLIPPR